ncbi:MAG: 50S ribosomal protein L24e [Promethearchaeota archaeon]
MVRTYNCTFCGHEITPGTGSTYVRRDGQLLRFCCSKCRKARINYKRDPRKLKWTKFYERKIK